MPPRDFPIRRNPRHHPDGERPSDHVHSLELFFDLVHVATIVPLGTRLSHQLDWRWFRVFTGLFVEIFHAWPDGPIYNSLDISTNMPHRAATAVQIVAMMFTTAAIPEIGHGGQPIFAADYGLNRAPTGRLYWRARTMGTEENSLACEMGRNVFALAALFLVGAVLPKPYAWRVFGASVVLIQLQYMAPRLGALRFERLVPRFGHLSERFALLMPILPGEGFFKLVATLTQKGVAEAYAVTLFNLIMDGFPLFGLPESPSNAWAPRA